MKMFTKFEGFWDACLIDFWCFLLSAVRGLAMQKHRFVLVFTVFALRWPFHKKTQNDKWVVKNVCVFWEGCRHHLSLFFGIKVLPKWIKNHRKMWSAGLLILTWKTCPEKLKTSSKTDPKMRSQKVICLILFKGLGPRVPQGGPKDPPRAPKVTPKTPKVTPKVPRWGPKAINRRQKIGENWF